MNLFQRLQPTVKTALMLLALFLCFSGPDVLAEGARFGVVADVQYCDCANVPEHNRYYAETKDRLSAAKDAFNRPELDFVISLGDIIDGEWRSFEVILPVFDAIDASSYHVLGNHAFQVEDRKQPQVPERLGMPARYYHFVYRDWRFLVLDANDLSVQAQHPPDSDRYARSDALYQRLASEQHEQARRWNGGIGTQQQLWLADQPEAATRKRQNVIVFSHMPLVPLNLNTLWNYREIQALLGGYDWVKAHFSGHYHDGNYQRTGGLHHVTFKAILDTPDEKAFAIVALSENEITVHGYGREDSRILQY